MPLTAAQTHVFRRHALDGFEPCVPHIRYPVTIGLYREGPNLGLFLAPLDLPLARRLTGIADTDHAVVLRGPAFLEDAYLAAEGEAELRTWQDLDSLCGDVDVIHLPEGSRVRPSELGIDTPLLAAPEQAVPSDLGSRVAIGFADGCHTAIISPDDALIRRTLSGFISAYAAEASQRPAPALSSSLIDVLMEPHSPGRWHELRWLPARKFFALEVAPNGDTTRATRWVCGGHGQSWRPGWSW